jgi:hypothetical protein
MPLPHTWPRTNSTPHLPSPASASASSSRAGPALSQTRSSPGTSARASPASQTSSGRGRGRGRHGCYGSGDDDVDVSVHVVATNSDRAGRETRVERLYYTLDDVGGIVTNGLGRGTRRYLLELFIVYIRNVYNPSTYRDGVIKKIISAFNSRYPMPEHLVVSSAISRTVRAGTRELLEW